MQTKEQRDKWCLKNKSRINPKRRIRYAELKKNPEWFKHTQKTHHENYLKNKTKQLKKEHIRYHTIIKKNPEMMKRRQKISKAWAEGKRRKVINYYSKGKNCCDICGENDYDVLTIDHINGGGSQHRKIISKHIASILIKNNFPDGYRILCMNCNMKEAKRNGFYGTRRFKQIADLKKV